MCVSLFCTQLTRASLSLIFRLDYNMFPSFMRGNNWTNRHKFTRFPVEVKRAAVGRYWRPRRVKWVAATAYLFLVALQRLVQSWLFAAGTSENVGERQASAGPSFFQARQQQKGK